MREITDHRCNPVNDRLTVTATDEPGPGGANHCYSVGGFESGLYTLAGMTPEQSFIALCFQKGTIPEAGVNGVTHEALLAIVIDRLRSFQDGPFKCAENAEALKHAETALDWLHKRTRKRMERGVEGIHAA